MTRRNRTRTPRRTRARRACGLRVSRVVYGPEVGPDVVQASLAELERALRSQPEDLPWSHVCDDVIPVMPRVRAYPPGFPEPLRLVVDPGVAIGFAIDIGAGFMAIGTELIRSWGIAVADVHARSLVNAAERASRIDPGDIYEGGIDGTPTRWLQTGVSIGSVLVLLPDEIERIFGPAPAFFITPMRDLIIGLPADVDPALAAWLWLEIAAEDPNCLGPTGYAFDGRSIHPVSLDSRLPGEHPPHPRDAHFLS